MDLDIQSLALTVKRKLSGFAFSQLEFWSMVRLKMRREIVEDTLHHDEELPYLLFSSII